MGIGVCDVRRWGVLGLMGRRGLRGPGVWHGWFAPAEAIGRWLNGAGHGGRRSASLRREVEIPQRGETRRLIPSWLWGCRGVSCGVVVGA